MRKSLFTIAGLFSLFLIATADKAQAANCQDLLANNLYRCRIASELGELFEDCFQFVSPGVVGTKFDLSLFGGEEILECECKANGSVSKPKFNASTAFLCGNAEFGDAVEGKVSGNSKKITKGQFFFNDELDESLVFECVLDPACSAPTLTTSATGNPHRR
jgi:hypothetical protein